MTAIEISPANAPEITAQGPVVLGLALREHAPHVAVPLHLHRYTHHWSREALALAIDVRDEGSYSRDLPEPTLAAIAQAIGLFIAVDAIEYMDPLAFAFQRVVAPRSRQTYCPACDQPRIPAAHGGWITYPNPISDAMGCSCLVHAYTDATIDPTEAALRQQVQA